MIKIRLSRTGTKNKPYYRIVATDERKKRASSSLGVIGFWHPRKKVIKIDSKKLDYWVGKGAQITEAVGRLISKK